MSDALDAAVEAADVVLYSRLPHLDAQQRREVRAAMESRDVAIAARACAPLVNVMQKVATGLASGYGYKDTNREQMVAELRAALAAHREKQP